MKRRKRLAEAEALAEYFGEGFCVISNNCFGGRLYQDLELPYGTPTAGMFIIMADFIEFCKHLPHYLREAELTFVPDSKWEHIRQRRRDENLSYPIGLLDGKVELHFLHYASEEEARSKWLRRAARVDFDKVVVAGLQIYGVSDADYRDFETIPYSRKYFFTTAQHEGCPSEIVLPTDGPDTVGDGMRHTKRFYRAWLEHIGCGSGTEA
ncbi:MAG: DUF1919 domain-containing protein [Muribaculaceae bacterium]|nr:DUF1919 domain-containing protein [Muribaculaceae bacterium]